MRIVVSGYLIGRLSQIYFSWPIGELFRWGFQLLQSLPQSTIKILFLVKIIRASQVNLFIIKMAGASAVSTVAKPLMRGLLDNAIKRNLIISLALAGISGFAFQQLVAKERKRKYAEFYRTYDAEKEFEEMKAKGLFQSC